MLVCLHKVFLEVNLQSIVTTAYCTTQRTVFTAKIFLNMEGLCNCKEIAEIILIFFKIIYNYQTKTTQ
jgi:hypothetical protein